MYFNKKVPDFRIPKYVRNSPITKLFFTQKIALSYTGAFHENFLSMACCTFRVLEARTITPSIFKNQSSGTMKTLAHNCNHQQGFVKQKNCRSPSLWL